MANLVFALICEKTVQNSNSSMDLVNIITGVELSRTPAEADNAEANTESSRPFCEIVSRWVRSDADVPESVEARIQFLDQKKSKIIPSFVMNVDLLSADNLFVITQLDNLPSVQSSGVYNFQIQAKKSNKWRTVAEIPIYFKIMESNAAA